MKKIGIIYIIILAGISCNFPTNNLHVNEGPWLGHIITQENNPDAIVPFNMLASYINNQLVFTISNGKEKIIIDEIEIIDDSIFIQIPVFDNVIKGIVKENSIKGRLFKNGYSMAFYAVSEMKDRFPEYKKAATRNIDGRWEVTEFPGTDHEMKMVGEFQQKGTYLTGTFLTVVGDYRFLEGSVSGDEMVLSCFDGSHSLIFRADIENDNSIINGQFYGSPSWKSNWVAHRNDTIKLPDPSDLTYLKDGFEYLDFAFPDLDGNIVSLTDEQFKNKGIIVQILGTWCPNCMDETRYFAEMYDQYNDQGLEIIALCFEPKDYEKSIPAIERFKTQTGANYTFLYAGDANKKEAIKVLPMLNKIISYPTAIFINRKGEVRKIHTGFTGPGTGHYYDELVNEFEKTISKII